MMLVIERGRSGCGDDVGGRFGEEPMLIEGAGMLACDIAPPSLHY